MVYTRLTKFEVENVSAILDSHGVNYRIKPDEEAIAHADSLMKDDSLNIRPHSRDVLLGNNAFYSMEINQQQLKALTPGILLELEKHRIFPEVEEVPDFGSHSDSKPKIQKTTLSQKIVVGMIAFILITFLALMIKAFIESDLFTKSL
jgi:hypothetical protein